VFPEKREGPALLSFESLFPTRQPHENNSCATLDYSHLSFGEVQHRPVIQRKCFKSCTQAERWSWSRIKSGTTKEKHFQWALCNFDYKLVYQTLLFCN